MSRSKQMRFKLKFGMHQQAKADWSPSPEEIAEAARVGRTPKAPTVSYYADGSGAGNVVESDEDLVAKFGPKFARLADRKGGTAAAPPPPSTSPAKLGPTPGLAPVEAVEYDEEDEVEYEDEPKAVARPTQKELSAMTPQQLRRYAADNEIELRDATRKADIVSRILEAVEAMA